MDEKVVCKECEHDGVDYELFEGHCTGATVYICSNGHEIVGNDE